jgi:hypothetical protein
MSKFIGTRLTLPNLATAPSSPAAGDAYYDTVANTAYVYNGTSWVDLAASGGGSGDITDVVAGSGLTGGATSGSATLNVGAGTGITVNVDDVAIDTTVVARKTDKLSAFAATTSAELAGVVLDETGSGALVFGTGPTLVTPNLGTPSAINLSNATSLADAALAATGTAGTYTKVTTDAKGRVSSGTTLSESDIPTLSTVGKVSNSATTAASANTASAIVARDASGNFTAGTITATTVTGLSAPSSSTDAVNKAYVDAFSVGLNWHAAVKAVQTANTSGVYTAGTSGFDGGTGVGAYIEAAANQAISSVSVDGYSSWALGDRLLYVGNTNAITNGIYRLTNLGGASSKWRFTRATDFDGSSPTAIVMAGDAVYVINGTTYGKSAWAVNSIGTGTNNDIIVGTDNIDFAQFNGAATLTAGAGLLTTGNTIDVVAGTGITLTGDQVSIDSTVATLTGTQAFTNKTSYNKIAITAPATSATLSLADGSTLATSGAFSTTLTATATTVATLPAGTKTLLATDGNGSGLTNLSASQITGTAVITTDSRLSDARTPTAHKTSHATGGSDALSAADIGAATSGHTHTGTTFDLDGDVTVTAGAFTLGAANVYTVAVDADSHNHTLGTSTNGNYIATVASANSLITVTGSGGEGGAVTLTADTSPSLSSLTVTGAATFNGAVTLGDAVGDSIRFLNMYQTTTITNSFNPRVYNASGATPWRIFYDTSSERFKDNIVYMADTDKILDVVPVSYHDKKDYAENGEQSPRQYGFLAEEMGANPEGNAFVVHNGADAETIQYDRLVVPLISAVRHLRKRVEELEAKVNESAS